MAVQELPHLGLIEGTAGRLVARVAAGALAATLALAAAAAEPVRSDPARVLDVPPAHDARYVQRRYLVLAVRIRATDATSGTYGDPPSGRLTVTEVLRGELPAGEYRYVVLPPDAVAGVADPRSPAADAWFRQPLAGPLGGEALIVFARTLDGATRKFGTLYLEGPLIADSAANRTTVRAQMREDLARSLLLLVPVLLAAAAALAWHLRRSRRRRAGR